MLFTRKTDSQGMLVSLEKETSKDPCQIYYIWNMLGIKEHRGEVRMIMKIIVSGAAEKGINSPSF